MSSFFALLACKSIRPRQPLLKNRSRGCLAVCLGCVRDHCHAQLEGMKRTSSCTIHNSTRSNGCDECSGGGMRKSVSFNSLKHVVRVPSLNDMTNHEKESNWCDRVRAPCNHTRMLRVACCARALPSGSSLCSPVHQFTSSPSVLRPCIFVQVQNARLRRVRPVRALEASRTWHRVDSCALPRRRGVINEPR